MLYMQSPFASYMERLFKEYPEHEWFAKYGGPDEDKMLEMLAQKGQEAEAQFLKAGGWGERERERAQI